MSSKKLVAIIAILLLSASTVFLATELMQSRKEAERLRSELTAAQAKDPVIEFNRLFVEQVLRAESEVSFETRLNLENKVRNLGDQGVLDQWNKFVNAQTETEAQAGVKSLLGLLAEKMTNN